MRVATRWPGGVSASSGGAPAGAPLVPGGHILAKRQNLGWPGLEARSGAAIAAASREGGSCGTCVPEPWPERSSPLKKNPGLSQGGEDNPCGDRGYIVRTAPSCQQKLPSALPEGGEDAVFLTLICVSNAETQPCGDLRLPSALHRSVKERGGAASLGLRPARLHAAASRRPQQGPRAPRAHPRNHGLCSFLCTSHGFPHPPLFLNLVGSVTGAYFW